MIVETAPSQDELANRLSATVADDLRTAIQHRGRAFLAVPGGSTPAPFLGALAQADLDWAKVTITLTDERWVPVSSERSNHGLLKRSLLTGMARRAKFIPLFSGEGRTREDGLRHVAAQLDDAPWPLDVAVLGMGEDMHTASLFPGSDNLAAALDPRCPDTVMALSPPDAPEPRISLTLPALASAARLYLLIHGAGKRAALERAMLTPRDEAPIRAVLEAAKSFRVFHTD